jgi:hypothetical protein
MSAFKKWQDRGASSSKAPALSPYSRIGPAVYRSRVEYLNRIVPPPSGHIDLSQVQVELCFVAFQT